MAAAPTYDFVPFAFGGQWGWCGYSFSVYGTPPPPPQHLGVVAALHCALPTPPPPVRKMILHVHTPARTSQCWSRQTQRGFGVCNWMHRVNGTGSSPSPGQPTPGVVKQDKSSGGSVDATKTRSDPQRVRMWRQANRHRQRQTTEYRGLVPSPPPPSSSSSSTRCLIAG